MQTVAVYQLSYVNVSCKWKTFNAYALVAGEDNFPQYIAEIRGLAAGAGVSYEKMFLHNIEYDIASTYVRPDIAQSLSLHSVKAEPVHHILDHCSTILLNQPGIKVMGHNEDGSEVLHRYAYMVSAQIYDPDFPPIFPCKQNISENKEGSLAPVVTRLFLCFNHL